MLRLWIIWSAVLMGQAMFLAMLVLVILPQRTQTNPPVPALQWVDLGMLVTVVPIAFLVRASLFRRARNESETNPMLYATGNLVFWAACESVAFLGLVAAVVNGSLKPTMFVVAIAVGLQVLAFPRPPQPDR
jgi:hypothetical protein